MGEHSPHLNSCIPPWRSYGFHFALPEPKHQFDAWFFQWNESSSLASGSTINTQTFVERLDPEMRNSFTPVYVKK